MSRIDEDAWKYLASAQDWYESGHLTVAAEELRRAMDFWIELGVEFPLLGCPTRIDHHDQGQPVLFNTREGVELWPPIGVILACLDIDKVLDMAEILVKGTTYE